MLTKAKKLNIAKRVIALVLALMLAAVSFAFVGCQKEQGPSLDNNGLSSNINTKPAQTSSQTTEESSSEAETSAVTESETTQEPLESESDTEEESTDTEETVDYGEGISIFSDGKVNHNIVIGKNAPKAVSDTANTLKAALKTAFGVTTDVRKENNFKVLNGGTLDGPKIVIGALEGDELSQELERGLYDGEYVIKVVDSVLYIIGGTNESTATAVDMFVKLYLKNAGDELTFEAGMLYDKKVIPEIENLKINGNPITDYVIVYYDSVYGKECAQKVQKAIADKIDLTLEMVTDTEKERACEILVGKTNRSAAKAIRGAYDRPNIYYDIEVKGTKLVVMGEGYRTLTKVGDAFKTYFSGIKEDNLNLKGKLIEQGSVLSDVEAADALNKALAKNSDVSVRVFHWNMAAPIFWSCADQNQTMKYADNETGHKKRAEEMADVILIYNPDVFTTNEMYKAHTNGWLYNTVKKELSEYFLMVNSPAYDKSVTSGVPNATVGAEYPHPEQIFFRRDKFTLVNSGWRFLSEKTTNSETGAEIYPVTYHGITWAILKDTKTGKQFILSVGHYGKSTTSNTYAKEHQAAVAYAQSQSGSSSTLPVILTGDMYTWSSNGSSSGYSYHKNNGYSDAQKSASLNCNGNTGHGTFHDVNVSSNKSRASEDFVWYNNKLSATKFGVIVLPQTTNTSDHWPVFADLKFK